MVKHRGEKNMRHLLMPSDLSDPSAAIVYYFVVHSFAVLFGI
jgi:hypothetical protein